MTPTHRAAPTNALEELPFDRVGDAARASGLVALVMLLVPVVGDVVSVAAGVLAVVLGAIGVRRYETGRVARPGAAVVGLALGTLSIVAVVLFQVMTARGW